MIRKLDYRWRLRQVMADRGMFATTDLPTVTIQVLRPQDGYVPMTAAAEAVRPRT